MKIFISKLLDFTDTLEIDLELILFQNEFLKDHLIPIQNFLFQTNRNIIIKITNDLNKIKYHNKIFHSKTFKEHIITYYECSFNPFTNEELDIEEYEIKNIYKIENLDENTINFVYINEKTNEQFNIIGKKIDNKPIDNRYQKLKPIYNWYVNNIHLVTICNDLSCNEFKLFYKEPNSLLNGILFEVFDFIEKNYQYLQEFITYNTSHPFSELSISNSFSLNI